nr:kinesin light chain 1-like [Hydra vulgaris]
MSGAGKTQLTRKYCEIHHDFYERFVWIDAGFGKLHTSMINLYELLGFVVQDSQGNSFNIEVIVEKIHNYYKNEKTLYIFDNVDDESVRNLGMFISKKPKSFTLFTTQWRRWSNKVNQMLIDVFSSKEAFEYVKNSIKENTDESIKNLIKELSYHPFAITQAIKYIEIHKISTQKYIDRYKSNPIKILDDEYFPTEEKSKSAIKAINLVLKKLERKKIIPLKLLNCLSYCNGQSINKEFITQIIKQMTVNEDYLIDEAVGLLISYSLLDRLDDEKYSMHELTQMSKTFHQMTTSIQTLLVCKSLFQEAIEILKSIKKFNAETYGENNKFTTDTKHNIASCWIYMGKYNEALEIYYSVDKKQTEILGINHPDTMSTKVNIASCLNAMGKYNEALEIYYSVDKIQTEILGINYPDTMSTKNNIANCLSAMGKYIEALEIYYSVDKIQTEILGINYPDTMSTKNNIANCLSAMGKYIEALEIYYSVDKIQTETLGINHPSTIGTKNNIASCLYAMGKYNEVSTIQIQ